MITGTTTRRSRVTGLGATTVKETTLPAVRWTTFAGPEGNEFDVVTWQPE
jgi:hypothetical protein